MIKQIANHPEFECLAQKSKYCSRSLNAQVDYLDNETAIQVLYKITRSEELSKPIYEGKVTKDIRRLISSIIDNLDNHPELSGILTDLIREKELRDSQYMGMLTRDVVSSACPEFLTTIMEMPGSQNDEHVLTGQLLNPNLSEPDIVRSIENLHQTGKAKESEINTAMSNAVMRITDKQHFIPLMGMKYLAVWTALLRNPQANESLAELLLDNVIQQLNTGYGDEGHFVGELARSHLISLTRLEQILADMEKTSRYRFDRYAKELESNFDEKYFLAVWATYHKDGGMLRYLRIFKKKLSPELLQRVKTDIANGHLDDNKAIEFFEDFKDRVTKKEIYEFANRRFKHWPPALIKLLCAMDPTRDEASTLYMRTIFNSSVHNSPHAHLTFTREIKKALSKVMTERDFRKLNKNHRAMKQFG